MDREPLIQVNFQIPPSALDSLSRLAEQLRLLTEAANVPVPSARTAETESMESGSFDPERFMALRQGVEKAEAVRADVSDIRDAPEVSAAVSYAEDAVAVSAGVRKELRDAKGAGDSLEPRSENAAANEALYSLPGGRDLPPPQAAEAAVKEAGPVPAVRAEAEEFVPDAPEARREAERQVPEVESVRAEAEARELAIAAARGEVSGGGIEATLGAGVIVQAQPEMPQNRWSSVTEELVIPGPAPLTAEAVSLAFERDGRRYDNGFPLY